MTFLIEYITTLIPSKVIPFAFKKENPFFSSNQIYDILSEEILFEMIFFLIGIHSMQSRTAPMRHGVTTKRSTKRLHHTGNLFRKNLQLKDVC